VALDKVIPKLEYEVVETYEKEKLRDVVVKVPQVMPRQIEREIVIPIIEYETTSVFGKDVVKDVVVRIPQVIVLDKEEQVPVRAVEAETAEQYIVETVPGTVVKVPIMVEQPLYIFNVVDVIETEAVPPKQNPLSIRTTTPPVTPAIPMPSGNTTAPSLGGSPAPRGRGEKEKLVI
ncbi:MAG: hypothetical protein LM558_04995, partial [Thermosphaera sp.]|nr:hypothetical protein [Thermosphaera sp.]